MTQNQKLIEKFLANPSSVRFSKIEKILFILGFFELKMKGGSHRKFKHALLKDDLVIPVHNNDCKDFYKEQIAKKIRQFFKS